MINVKPATAAFAVLTFCITTIGAVAQAQTGGNANSSEQSNTLESTANVAAGSVAIAAAVKLASTASVRVSVLIDG